MAYTKGKSDADQYFSTNNHLQADIWKNATTAQKNASLAQAKRMLEMWLNRSLENPSTTDTYRDDYAQYEQALYMIRKIETPSGPGNQTTSRRVPDASQNQVEKMRNGVGICMEAADFLFLKAYKMVRG